MLNRITSTEFVSPAMVRSAYRRAKGEKYRIRKDAEAEREIAERTGDVKKTSWRFTKSLHSLFSLFDVHLLGTKVESCSAHVIVSQRHGFDS